MENKEPNIENILKIGMNDDPNYDELMNAIKVSCPVKKININVQTPGGVIGMFLLTDPNAIELLKEKADLDDLNENTILFFNNQHLVELSNIINGMLSLLESSHVINTTNNTVHRSVMEFINLCKNPIDYHVYKNKLKTWRTTIEFKNFFASTDIVDKIISILEIIPFISYNNLDEIASKSIEEFKDKVEDITNKTEEKPNDK